jgi:hypothetical protein
VFEPNRVDPALGRVPGTFLLGSLLAGDGLLYLVSNRLGGVGHELLGQALEFIELRAECFELLPVRLTLA